MSESTTPAQCQDEDWNLARDCGLMGATPGTNAWDAALSRFAETIRAARLADARAEALTDEQIAEQPARYSIDGAIAFGRMGFNEPEQGHWLMEYWSIGRQLAELGKTSSWDNQTPLAAKQPSEDKRDAERYRWLREDREWEPFDSEWLVRSNLYGEEGPELDAIIDAAIAKGEAQ